MEKNKTDKSIIKYIIPSAVTMVMYCIVLAVKGIYPFGNNTIDYYDMAQQIAAFYYHVYDMLHGTKAFYYDFYTALGVNMAMSTSGCSNLSLFNLFFLFIKRDVLLNSLSIFHGIKIICMSATMYFYLHKTHKNTPYLFELIASVGYAFCGFVLVLYITNQWVDIAALFPLVMYFYDSMLKEGKIKGYVITLTLTLVASYYLGFMILIFLFLYTGLKLIAERIFETKENRQGIHVIELGVGTVLSLMLSAFILAPQLTQMLSSARFKNGNEQEGMLATYLEILSHVEGDYTTRWWSLLGISLCCAVIAVGLFKNRKDKKNVFVSVSMILIVVLELFFESINLIWHFGSYVQYPIRNGFIIYFVFAYLGCYYAGKLFDNGFDKKGLISFAFTIVGFATFVIIYRNNPGMPLRKVFHITSAMMAASFILCTGLCVWKKGLYYSGVIGIWCCELLCYSFLLYGQPDFITGYAEEPEQNGEYIRICDQLNAAFELEPGFLYRTKNPDTSLNANYGLAMRQPVLSNWTHMLAPDEQSSAARWGYTIQFTRILDAGGTVFTDALLGIRNVISLRPMDEALYTPVKSTTAVIDSKTGETAEYTLYAPKYTLPFGVLLHNDRMVNTDTDDMVELHNIIYQAMTDTDDEIAGWYIKDDVAVDNASVSIEKTDESKDVVVDISVKGTKALYLSGSGGDHEDANSTIELTDKEGSRFINVPTIKYPDNIYYPGHFNNNAVYLGTFSNEDITIKVSVDLVKGEDFLVDISDVDLEKLDHLCKLYSDVNDDYIIAGGNTLDFSIKAEDCTIMLPLTYDKGWTITDNGKDVTAQSYAGLFTAISLTDGENNVHMKFTPVGTVPGTFVSLVALLIIAAYLIIMAIFKEGFVNKIKDILDKLSRWVNPLYSVVVLIVVVFMFVVPVIYGTIERIMK